MKAHPSPEATRQFERLLRHLLEANRCDEHVEVTRAASVGWMDDPDTLLITDTLAGTECLITVREVT